MKKIRRNHVEIKKVGKIRFILNEILDIINPIFIDGEVGDDKKRILFDLEKMYEKKLFK